MGEHEHQKPKPATAGDTHAPRDPTFDAGERIFGWKPLRVSPSPVFPSAGPLDMGEREVGARDVKDVWVSNDDPMVRRIAAIAIEGSPAFHVDRSIGLIPAERSAAAAIAFAPTREGPVTARVVVTPDLGKDVTLELVGRGTARAPKAEPPTQTPPVHAPAGKPPDASHHRLALPPVIELDAVVGKVRLVDAPLIFALDTTATQGPRFEARIVGVPGARILHAPGYIPTTRVAPDELSHLKLEVRADKEGPIAGALELEILDSPHERVRIPIRGTAYRDAIPEPSPQGPPELAPLAEHVDLGEQIVGSEHWFTIGSTGLAKPYPEIGTVTSGVFAPERIPDIPDSLRMDLGTNAFTASTERRYIGRQWPLQPVPLRVLFKPTRTGPHRADVVVSVKWDNDRTSTQRIAVTASARTLEDAPAQPEPEHDVVTRPALVPAKRHRLPTTDEAMEFGTEANTAADGVAHLADAQHDGLDAAFGAIRSFDKEVDPDRPFSAIVGALADLALTMATGGIAQVVSKAIAGHVVAKLARQTVGDVKSLPLTDGLGAAVKDGLKSTMKDAIARLKSAGHVSSHGEGEERVKFFARQRSILTEVSNQNRELVRSEERRLRPFYGDRPKEVLAIFKGLQAAFAEQAKDAENQQRHATLTQWIRVTAQESQGREIATRGGKELGPAAKLDRPDLNAHGDGVLEFEVDIDDRSTVTVHGIEIRGIAQEAIDDLRTFAPRDLKVPIRVIAKSAAGTAFITRDDAGRVHAVGVLPKQDPLDDLDLTEPQGQLSTAKDLAVLRRREIQLHRDATKICDLLDGRALDAWHVTIKTNDKHAKQGPR